MRQQESHYVIHAGQSLSVSGLRYLRIVRVTTAVYQSLDSKLAPLLLSFWHRADVSPFTSSYDFAETCVFIKQLPSPIMCHLIIH